MGRRELIAVVALAAILHTIGIARSILPAQDGLKFLRVARRFQLEPWSDVVRGSDQHPLYPLAVAAVEPGVTAVLGPGPEAWRIAAQLVSALAAIALLLPLYGLTRALFDKRAAVLATLLFVLLPVPAEVGHDTLSDALALALFTAALWCGERAWRTGSLPASAGCALASGLGYWTRPEAAVLPAALLGAAGVGWVLDARGGSGGENAVGLEGATHPTRRLAAIGAAALGFLTLVGSYALVKGEVSEKLALRLGAGVMAPHDRARPSAAGMPPGLDDPRLDFAPKEAMKPAHRLGLIAAALKVLAGWSGGLGGLFAAPAVWGAWRVRAGPGRWAMAAFVALFALVLVRHATALSYLSGRHPLMLVVATLPWAAAGTCDLARRVASRRGWDARGWAWRRGAAVAALVVAGAALQSKPAHASRWGHLQAGRWLAAHAAPGVAVLDTRGWAAFTSGVRTYDYWHVRQALTDARLRYVVVGVDELKAGSRRAATLRALLGYAGELAAAFPGRPDGSGVGVRVYRFHPPESWEGLRP